MIDADTRLRIINSGLIDLILKQQWAIYIGDIDSPFYSLDISLYYSKEDIKIANKMINSKNQKLYRFKKRAKSMIESLETAKNSNLKILFLTLTFNDETLADTTKETRRRYISRFLSGCCVDYIANIDFGKLNGREHYHALVLVDGKIDLQTYGFGSINLENVSKRIYKGNNLRRITKYVNKLANHATKDGTLCVDRLIYCKKKDIKYESILPF